VDQGAVDAAGTRPCQVDEAGAPRRRSTAKNTRSGVAGLSNLTTGRAELPADAKAPTASRSASRTEIASMSGGSPIALLP
jgi:hypothetical protein